MYPGLVAQKNLLDYFSIFTYSTCVWVCFPVHVAVYNITVLSIDYDELCPRLQYNAVHFFLVKYLQHLK